MAGWQSRNALCGHPCPAPLSDGAGHTRIGPNEHPAIEVSSPVGGQSGALSPLNCGRAVSGIRCLLEFGFLLGATGTRRLDEAVAHVVIEQNQGHALQRAGGRRDLGQDVDTVLVLVRHARDPMDLTFTTVQARGLTDA